MSLITKHKKILVFIFIIIFLWLVTQGPLNHIMGLFNSLDIESIKAYILSFGLLAPVVSFLLMMFQSLIAPLPAFLITFSNAAIFGWVKGALLSWTSAMAGASLCFYISRYLGRDAVSKMIGNRNLEELDVFFDKYGKHAILIARLLPFVSFDFVSYAAGLTSISFASFFIATGLGQLPATIIYSYIGSVATGSVKNLIFFLLITFALIPLISMIRKIYMDKKELNK